MSNPRPNHPRSASPRSASPRITSTASAQFVYEDPRAAIIRPDQFASLSHYFITHWLPEITPNGLKILMRLRSLGYYQPKTGVQRGDIDIDQPQLAQQCGMGLRTLQRIFSEDAVLAKYVQRVFQVERDKHGRIIREHYIYVVKMDDVLTGEDEGRLATTLQSIDKGQNEEKASPTRQNGISENTPTRQNGGMERQYGTPTRQNGGDRCQNGGSYNESLTSLTQDTPNTLGAPPELSASLLSEEEKKEPTARPWADLPEPERAPWLDKAEAELKENFGGAVWAKTKEKARASIRGQRAANLYLEANDG